MLLPSHMREILQYISEEEILIDSRASLETVGLIQDSDVPFLVQ
jgi:hypothetical protein